MSINDLKDLKEYKHRYQAALIIRDKESRGRGRHEIIKQLVKLGYVLNGGRISFADLSRWKAPKHLKDKDLSENLDNLFKAFILRSPTPPSEAYTGDFPLSKDEVLTVAEWVEANFKVTYEEASIRKIVLYHYQSEMIRNTIKKARARIYQAKTEAIIKEQLDLNLYTNGNELVQMDRRLSENEQAINLILDKIEHQDRIISLLLKQLEEKS
jgi:hypothetical protein